MKTDKKQYPNKMEVRKMFLLAVSEMVIKEKNIKAKRDEAERLGLTWAGLLEAVGNDNIVGADFLPKWFEQTIRKDPKINEIFESWETQNSNVKS